MENARPVPNSLERIFKPDHAEERLVMVADAAVVLFDITNDVEIAVAVHIHRKQVVPLFADPLVAGVVAV